MARHNKPHPTERTGRNPKLEESEVAAKSSAKKAGTAALAARISELPGKAWRWLSGLDRNTKLAGSLALVLIIVGLLTVVLSSGKNSSQNGNDDSPSEIAEHVPLTNASITLRQGTLEIKTENGEWEDAPEGTTMKESSGLRTVGATSRAVVTFEDGSELRLDANSEIEIASLSSQRIEVKQIAGYSYHRLLPAEGRNYIVFSNDAHYESLGTAFKVAASGDEQAVEVYHSSVHETTTNKKPNEGEKLTVNNRSTPSKNGTIEKLDIELIKQDQFTMWNLGLDKASDKFKNDLGFLRDTEAPELSVNTPADGETVLLDPDADEGTTTFSGTTERGAKLTVQSKSLANSPAVEVAVGDDGSFTTPVMSAPLGNSVFEFVARDRTGNKTTLNVRMNFQRKSSPVSGGLTLQASLNGSKVQLSWSAGGLALTDGVQLVYGKSPIPSYGSASAVNIKNSNSHNIAVNQLDSDERYYFRVCVYDADNDTCSSYSSQRSVDIP